MKIHLGCGKRRFPGFVQVDIREDVEADIIDDVFKLEKFGEERADLIYYCHGLEHVDKAGAPVALKRWYDVLKPGGVLRLSVPDIRACAELYVKGVYPLETFNCFFWGSQKFSIYDYHYTGWDEPTLGKAMLAAGFKEVRLWDWRTTPPHDTIDDYCRAYLPHMDFENGKLMSLNLESIK